jgi:hypothetical protein
VLVVEIKIQMLEHMFDCVIVTIINKGCNSFFAVVRIAFEISRKAVFSFNISNVIDDCSVVSVILLEAVSDTLMDASIKMTMKHPNRLALEVLGIVDASS